MFTIARSPSDGASGMGANLYPGGCHFRIWAPHASKVTLLIREYAAPDGSDNWTRLNFNPDAANAAYWSGDVDGVVHDHEYSFEITNIGGSPLDPGPPAVRRAHPYARDVLDSSFHSPALVVDPAFTFTANFQTPRFENLILYQMHVGSFAGRGDGIKVDPKTNAARFENIQSKLGYIKSMNFNAIQLLPAGEYRGADGEGYNPTNFFAPETSYGDPSELRRLVDEAHRLGLAVFFDMVYNHLDTIDNNLWQFDGNKANNEGGIYFSTVETGFGRRPAHDRVEVQNFFVDNGRMWLREYNVDGLRFDSAHNIEFSGFQRIVGALAWEFPAKFLYAEYNNPPYAFENFAIDAAWDMGSADSFRYIVNSGDLSSLQSLISHFGFPTGFSAIKYLLGSHDQIFNQWITDKSPAHFDKGPNRYFVERIGGEMVGRTNWYAQAKARLGWALNVAIPCTPMLFMGSECHHSGYWNPQTDDFGDHRFDWQIAGDPLGMPMRRLVADANQVRWDNPALRSDLGPLVVHVDRDNHVLAFKRWTNEGNVVVVVVNLSDNQWEQYNYGVQMGGERGQWQEIFNSQSPQYGGWNDSGNFSSDRDVQADGAIYIRLPKWSVLMFRKR